MYPNLRVHTIRVTNVSCPSFLSFVPSTHFFNLNFMCAVLYEAECTITARKVDGTKLSL